MKTENNNSSLEIGKGRSGTVFRQFDNSGNDLAVKVFSGVDELTNFVNYVFTGAPNSYGWSEDAVQCAHIRREILSILVPLWFDSHVRIANSFGIGWNENEKAYRIDTEFINGRPASLHHPFSAKTDWEEHDLSKRVMKPLQKKLIQSGFDGLVWQAGKGNPIALNNFLLDKKGDWIWIDAESGVPALFPLNPLSLLSFYLPNSIKHKRALFDDVNIRRLRRYAKGIDQKLEQGVGIGTYHKLNALIDNLEDSQKNWKLIRRTQKSIIYQLKKGNITEVQADWYSKHKLNWRFRETARFIKKATVKIACRLPVKVFRKLVSIKYLKLIRNSWQFLFNSKFRKESAERLIKSRIGEWEKRGQLNGEQAAFLRSQAEQESTSPYLADFIILIALKPLTNVIELVLLPALYAAGLINEAVLAIGVSLGGVIYRSVYTISKMIYEQIVYSKEKRNPRWIALLVGLIPTIGNAAYPTQMVFSASSKSKELAEFLMYDIASRIGAKIPIWGGKDTQTEHFFNHLPDIVVRKRKRA